MRVVHRGPYAQSTLDARGPHGWQAIYTYYLQMQLANFEASATFLFVFDVLAICSAFAPELRQLSLGGQTQVPFLGAFFQKVATVLLSRGEASLNVRIYALQPRDLRAVSFPRSEIEAQKFSGFECLLFHILRC